MLTRIQIGIALAIAVVAWGMCLVVFGEAVSWTLLKPFFAVVGVMAGVALFVEHAAWAWGWLNGWLLDIPDLRGTWRVKLVSDWVDPATEQGIAPIDCYMSVTQTASTLQMCLLTAESKSYFLAHSLRRTPGGSGYEIVGLYTNKPQLGFRPKQSGIHLGAVNLETHGPMTKPNTIDGEYWTDRKTTGTLTLDGRKKRVFTRYEDARNAFEA